MPRPKTTKRRSGQILTEEERTIAQETFLTAFAEYANVTHAAAKAGVDRSAVYLWRHSDPSFAERFSTASEEADDVLRMEAYRRAVIGDLEPVVSGGKVVTHIRKRSDTLLILLMRARMPEFRDKVDISGNLTVGAYRVIEEASSNPEIAERVSDLLKLIAAPTDASTGDSAGGPGSLFGKPGLQIADYAGTLSSTVIQATTRGAQKHGTARTVQAA